MATPCAAASGSPEAWAEEREAKIRALLGEMTTKEKIMQIGQVDKVRHKSLGRVTAQCHPHE